MEEQKVGPLKNILFLGHGRSVDGGSQPMVSKFCSPEIWMVITDQDLDPNLDHPMAELPDNILCVDKDSKVGPDIVMDVAGDWKELGKQTFDSIVDTMVCEGMKFHLDPRFWAKVSRHLNPGGLFLGCCNMLQPFNPLVLSGSKLHPLINEFNHFVLIRLLTTPSPPPSITSSTSKRKQYK